MEVPFDTNAGRSIKVGTLISSIGKTGVNSHLVRINEVPLRGIDKPYLPYMKSFNLKALTVL